MKIEYREGDLFQTDETLILHGCNDQGVMGSGVAKIVREKYPEAYFEYCKAYKLTGLPGGTFIPVHSNGKVILNAITQRNYGRDGKRYVNYEWIARIFKDLNDYVDFFGYAAIAMPKVGAQLGGGDWNVISAIIESESKLYKPIVYILPEGVATQ